MKVSGFTFIRDGIDLGYPFILSIKSILPICDEFIVVAGNSRDHTLAELKKIDSKKIKIIETTWNNNLQIKGFTYGEQKMIGQYACTGDWAFYIEGDEVIHEQDLDKIKLAMQRYLKDDNVEVLTFSYIHFHGNINTYAWSPASYRHAARIIKRSIRSSAPDGLYWTIQNKNNKKARYPKAAKTGATMYHYGWVRTEKQVKEKSERISHYWGSTSSSEDFKYSNVDPKILHKFTGSHPAGIEDFFPQCEGIIKTNPNYKLNKRERKNRMGLKLEKLFNLELSKKHFTFVD